MYPTYNTTKLLDTLEWLQRSRSLIPPPIPSQSQKVDDNALNAVLQCLHAIDKEDHWECEKNEWLGNISDLSLKESKQKVHPPRYYQTRRAPRTPGSMDAKLLLEVSPVLIGHNLQNDPNARQCLRDDQKSARTARKYPRANPSPLRKIQGNSREGIFSPSTTQPLCNGVATWVTIKHNGKRIGYLRRESTRTSYI